MTPYRKKLIEVALPLDAINRESAREKSIRHGHPSTLHLWWARRPLAACRAVLFASLVDDPDSDPQFRGADGTVDLDRAGVRRSELFNLIEELVKWENSNNEKVLNQARAEIAASIASAKVYDSKEWSKQQTICGEPVWNFICRLAKPAAVNQFLVEYAPPVHDPFCGGGSIPLEAQRLGLRAFGSDLNPVPVLITKALIEIPPKFANLPPVNPESNARLKDGWRGAQGLAEDVRYYGKWMRNEAEKRIGNLYPKVKITEEMVAGSAGVPPAKHEDGGQDGLAPRPDLKPYVGQELTVIAWIWARTVASPNPAVGGAHVPLVRSFWLSTKKGREAWVEAIIDRENNNYRFEVRVGKPPGGFDPGKGTVGGKKATCLLTGSPIPFPHIRAEGKAGRLGERLLAIVAEGTKGRVYLDPSRSHAKTALVSVPAGIPETTLPTQALSMRVMLYGMDKHHKLFTPRQLTALTTFSDLVKEAREKVLADAKAAGTLATDSHPLDLGGTGPQAYADAVATYLAFAVDKAANRGCTLCFWDNGAGNVQQAFGRQALPMTWDFCEANPFSDSSGSWNSHIDFTAKCTAYSAAGVPAGVPGVVLQQPAADIPLRDILVSTDPPYYDNIGYADLSDFFYIWLRRSLGEVFPKLFSTVLTPKTEELIASPYRHGGSKQKAQEFFETGLGQAFHRMREVQPPEFPMTVFYAFKQSETEEEDPGGGHPARRKDAEAGETPAPQATASTGWETMLEGLIRAGFEITGTWPIRTELTGNLKKNVSALASSVVLSCRRRPADAIPATRREFLAALKKELPEALRHLQAGNIAPVDLSQAAIGPGMAIFTRYAKVIEADGTPMRVRQALMLINQTLDEILAEQEGEFDADTRWALAWFEQFGMDDGPFGVAETLSKAKNTAINGLVDVGLVTARSGKVRLLKRSELPTDWNPVSDKRLCHWETTQHLIRALETNGEQAAAGLLRQLGGIGEAARDLAYRLYVMCERKKWAEEALAYNGLVIAWPEITKLAHTARGMSQTQEEMFR